ncbi:MAG: hypothetical protein Q9M36_00385 [Sulfurovum sp.]|nr:hypothetical protein [Sulfurovum sp.]
MPTITIKENSDYIYPKLEDTMTLKEKGELLYESIDTRIFNQTVKRNRRNTINIVIQSSDAEFLSLPGELLYHESLGIWRYILGLRFHETLIKES